MKDTDFCKICRYYLYLEETKIAEEKSEDKGDLRSELRRICRNCGYQEVMEGGLILELDLKEKTS